MKVIIKKLKDFLPKRSLNPEKAADRQQIVKRAVERTIREYGEALKRLGAE